MIICLLLECSNTEENYTLQMIMGMQAVGVATITDCSNGLQKRTVMNYLQKCNKTNNLADETARLCLVVNRRYCPYRIIVVFSAIDIANANICHLLTASLSISINSYLRSASVRLRPYKQHM